MLTSFISVKDKVAGLGNISLCCIYKFQHKCISIPHWVPLFTDPTGTRVGAGSGLHGHVRHSLENKYFPDLSKLHFLEPFIPRAIKDQRQSLMGSQNIFITGFSLFHDWDKIQFFNIFSHCSSYRPETEDPSGRSLKGLCPMTHDWQRARRVSYVMSMQLLQSRLMKAQPQCHQPEYYSGIGV